MFHFNLKVSVVFHSLCCTFALMSLMANHQTFSQWPSTHSGYMHNLSSQAGWGNTCAPWSPNLTYWAALQASRPADGQFCTLFFFFQVSRETVDTAGYTEQCLGAVGGKHQPFSLLSKLTAPSINTASIAYVWDLLIAATTTGYFQWIFFLLNYFCFQPSEVFKHHTL